MNQYQKIFLMIGLVVIVVMGIFPPWHCAQLFSHSRGNVSLGYYFIGYPPTRSPILYAVSVDVVRLSIQIVLVVLVTGIFMFLPKNQKVIKMM